jgi:hydrogenase-1 operon protein HyaF
MSSISKIPVRVEQAPTPDDFAVAQSVLHEIHALLEQLLAENEVGAIDLRSIHTLNQASLGLLEKWLATGEVSAVVTSVGRTEVRETAYPGVWWQVYRNEEGDIITESIHVTEVPDILISQKTDIKLGLKTFSGILSATVKQEFADQTAE